MCRARFGSICRIIVVAKPAPFGGAGVDLCRHLGSYLRFPRYFSVRRIHDERGSLGTDNLFSGAGEHAIVRPCVSLARLAWTPAVGLVEARKRCLLERSHLLIGQKLFVRKLIRTFQRCQNIPAGPNALQVRVTPRCLNGCPGVIRSWRASIIAVGRWTIAASRYQEHREGSCCEHTRWSEV